MTSSARTQAEELSGRMKQLRGTLYCEEHKPHPNSNYRLEWEPFLLYFAGNSMGKPSVRVVGKTWPCGCSHTDTVTKETWVELKEYLEEELLQALL